MGGKLGRAENDGGGEGGGGGRGVVRKKEGNPRMVYYEFSHAQAQTRLKWRGRKMTKHSPPKTGL